MNSSKMGSKAFRSLFPPARQVPPKSSGLPCHVEGSLKRLICFPQLFIGFGFPYEGPAPLEAIANGCVFLQARFNPPHSSLNHEFFRGKPTSREVSLVCKTPTRKILGNRVEPHTPNMFWWSGS